MAGQQRTTDLVIGATPNGRFGISDARNLVEQVAESTHDPMDPMFIEDLIISALAAEALPSGALPFFLGYSCKAGLVHVVQKLLELGADASSGQTLSRCVKELGIKPYRPYREIANLLLQHGSDPNKVADGATPLELALSGKQQKRRGQFGP